MEYGANGRRVNGVLGVSRAIGYCGIPDFAELVPSLSDSLILRRDAGEQVLLGCTQGRRWWEWIVFGWTSPKDGGRTDS